MAWAISQWAWKLFRLGQGDDTSNPEDLPYLPQHRRPLTPKSSGLSSTFIIPNGLFFERLPLELRQKILVDFFGNRPIHIALEVTSSKSPSQRLLHKNDYIEAPGPLIPALEESGPMKWRWRSCICHRNPPVEWKSQYFNGGWIDQCLSGRAYACHLWPGKAPERCHVDVIGWLLSCRQAYLEGSNILYSTNTFVIDTRLLAQNFSKLLLPQSLGLVTSLELIWEVTKPPAYDSTKPFEWPNPIDLPFRILAKTFPKLRKLHVSLYGDILSTGEADIDDENTKGIIEVREQVIFAAVAQFLGETEVQDLYLALNWTLWTQLRTKASRNASFVFEEVGYPGPRFWANIRGHKPDELSGRGCWVVEGAHGW